MDVADGGVYGYTKCKNDLSVKP